MDCRLKLNAVEEGRKVKRWNLGEMKEPEVFESFRRSISQGLAETEEMKTVEEELVAPRNKVEKAAEDHISSRTSPNNDLYNNTEATEHKW